MISINDCLARTIRVVRRKLGTRYRVLREKFGAPSEHSAMNSLHFLMEEYQEPPPFESVTPYRMACLSQPVEHRTEFLEHPLGKGKLTVDLTFPSNHDGTLPTVLISPGLGAHRFATRYIEQHLAGKGFLVVRPTHAGSNLSAVAMKTPLGAFSRTELRRRIAELSIAMEALEDRRWGISPCEGQVCMMGHSFGALTCAMFAGLRACSVEVQAPLSVDALVILSPYGNSFPTQRLGIDPGSFRDISAPTLFVSGTKDDLWTLGRGSRSHLEPYLLCQAPVKSHLMIGGARHGHFSQLMGWVRRDTKIMVNSTVTAFLDAHLKAESAGLHYLDSHLPLVAFEHGSWVL